MSRVGHTWVEVNGRARTTLDSSTQDFAETMGYERHRFGSPEEFLAYARGGWHGELHDALEPLLEEDRPVLSLGSGIGEHEVPFHLAGYDITASDIVPGAQDEAMRLFPGFRGRVFDVLDPPPDAGGYADVLATGFDSVLDDEQLERAFRNVHTMLPADGRFVFVQRYNDNPATWVIDRLLMPALAGARRLVRRGRPGAAGLIRREHGLRRSRAEIVRIARANGWRPGRIAHAGYAVELTRLGLDARLPRVYAVARRVDRRARVLNVCTVFELLKA